MENYPLERSKEIVRQLSFISKAYSEAARWGFDFEDVEEVVYFRLPEGFPIKDSKRVLGYLHSCIGVVRDDFETEDGREIIIEDTKKGLELLSKDIVLFRVEE